MSIVIHLSVPELHSRSRRSPIGWRFISCIQSAAPDGEWWVQLEGPEKPWPVRTAGAWGPTLRAAVERACWEAGAG